jgi:hypothetical protein
MVMSRDLMQVHRGMKADLPELIQGEFGLTLDEEKLYIGGLGGNIALPSYNDIKDIIPINPTGVDDTANFAAALAGGNVVIELLQGANYIIKGFNQCILENNTRVNGNGATITAPADTVLVDSTGTDGVYYNNGIFKVDPMVSVDNVNINNVNFVLNREKVVAVLIGDANAISGDVLRTNIHIANNTCKGISAVGQALFLGTNCENTIVNNVVEDTHFGIFGVGNKGKVENNICRYMGVTRDLTSWINASGIRFYGPKDMHIENNTVEYTGGTAISCSIAATPGENIFIIGNVIKNAGLAAIACANKGGEGYIKNAHIENNTIQGYNCAIDGDLHSCIDVGNGNTTAAGYSQDIFVKNNVIDFIGTFETLDVALWLISGNVNTKKNHNVAMGAAETISCRNENGATVNNLFIEGNIIRNTKTRGIHVSKIQSITITGNKLYNTGWERSDVGAVLDAKGLYAIRTEKCIDIKIADNTIRNCGTPSIASGSQSTAVILLSQNTFFNIINNKYFSSANNNYGFMLMVGGTNAGEKYTEFGNELDYIGEMNDNYCVPTIAILQCNKNFNYNIKYTLNSKQPFAAGSFVPVNGQTLDKLFVNSSLVSGGFMNVTSNADGLNYKIAVTV